MAWYNQFAKPVLDYGLALLIILFFWPILLFIYLTNILVFKSAIFEQTRIGKDEEPFSFLKFRTLKRDGDHNSAPFWGRLLRYSSLDELPQIVNVLRGEMSFIGPRPLLPEYLSEYSTQQRKRHAVKPGLTGLAQVSGRNKLAWEESLALDVKYAESISFFTDFKILLHTFPQLFKLGEVQKNKQVTREPFRGNQTK